jgi:hypothetical protein
LDWCDASEEDLTTVHRETLAWFLTDACPCGGWTSGPEECTGAPDAYIASCSGPNACVEGS